MWVSSSAFEKSLNTSVSLDPAIYGARVDPNGTYIRLVFYNFETQKMIHIVKCFRRYLPQLAKIPTEYIYEPWKAPIQVQKDAECVIGVDYPAPIINHKEVTRRNRNMMEELQTTLMKKCNMEQPKHIKPSDEAEIKVFFGLRSNET